MGIGLVAYSFKVNERRNSSNTYENLDDIDGNDMLNFVNTFLNNNEENFYTNEDSKKTFKIETINTDIENRRISGILTSGDAGIPAQIRNIHTPEEISYEKEEDDSECIPLYYIFYLPTNTHGVLILEKFGAKSAKYVLSKLIKNEFNEIFPHYVLNINPLPQRELMNLYFEHGGIKQMTLASYTSPGSNIEEQYARNGQTVEDLAMYEFTIRSRKNKNITFLKDKLFNIFNGSENVSSISDLVGIHDYVPDQLKVTFNVDGKQKTIRLDQLDELSAVYDISDEFDNRYEHPSYDQINPLAIDYLNNLLGN